MLGFGVASRLIFGWVLNLIGGLPTLLLGSAMQTLALALYLPFNGPVSLYVISAVFRLRCGGRRRAVPGDNLPTPPCRHRTQLDRHYRHAELPLRPKFVQLGIPASKCRPINEHPPRTSCLPSSSTSISYVAERNQPLPVSMNRPINCAMICSR
jgi:hypothetical protein